MIQKIFIFLISMFLIALPISAQEAEVEEWVCPEGYEGQSLSVYNWSTYIADDTISNFEEACGVTVSYDIYDSNETMLARIRQGNPGYDIVVPSGAFIGSMIAEDLLVPLDHELMPNFANLSENLLNPPYDPENMYSVPYQWGTVGVGYNVNKVDEIVTWEDVWNYDGPVAWLDDRQAMFGIALSLLGHDPNDFTPENASEARDYFLENGGNVVSIAQDDGQVQLERGDVDITIEYSGDIIDLIYECECEDYAYVIPTGGSNIWVDNLAIPVDAPNPELAMVFIDYMMNPQVGADISNFTAYGTPNQVAIDAGLIDAELLENPGIYPSEEVLAELFFSETLDADREQTLNDAWDELLIFLGQ